MVQKHDAKCNLVNDSTPLAPNTLKERIIKYSFLIILTIHVLFFETLPTEGSRAHT